MMENELDSRTATGTSFRPIYPLKHLIEQVRDRIDLKFAEAREASFLLADSAVSDKDKANFLIALREKGESGEELGHFARAFLELAVRPDVSAPFREVTICAS